MPETTDNTDRACAWSDFRKEYGVSANDQTRQAEYRAFCAGWDAAQGALDVGGPLR